MAPFPRRPRTLLASVAATAAAAAMLSIPTTASAAGPSQSPAAGASPPAVTFGAVPTTAALLAHYTVDNRAAARPASARSASARAESGWLGALRTNATARSALRQRAASPAVAGALAGPRRSGPGSFAERSRERASFIGMQSSKSICSYFGAGCNPPDMAVAASRRWVLQGVNTSFEVLDPRGHVQPGWPRSAQAFFGVPDEPGNCDPTHGNQPFLSDPRAFYDPSTGRFWAAMLQAENSLGVAPGCPTQGAYYIGVSQTGDPRGAWNVYKFDMTQGNSAAAGVDFTQVGFDAQAVYFTANVFDTPGNNYLYAEAFEGNKAAMERGLGAFTAAGFRSLTVTGAKATYLADTVQPVLTLSSEHDGEYLVDTFNGTDPVTGNGCTSAADACRGLALWRFAHPIAHDSGGPPPTLTATYLPNTLPYSVPPPGDQPTCTACVDQSDLRISAIPVFSDGRIYAGWESAINNGTQVVPGIEYAQISVGPASVRTSYYFMGGDVAVSYPALMPDGEGRVVMVFDRMASAIAPETRIVVGDTEEARFEGPGRLLKAGEAPYRPGLCGTAALPVCRWGDFSATSFDGHGTVWVAGQYANGNIGPSTDPNFSNRNWGTWIGSTSAD